MLSCYIIILLLLTIGPCLINDFGVMMTKKVLVVDMVAKDAITKLLSTLQIRDISGTSGILSYRLDNIIIVKVDDPFTSTMTHNSELRGLTVTLRHFGLRLYGHCIVNADMGLFHVMFNGSVDIGFFQVSTSVTGGLGCDQFNRPFLKALNCNYNIEHVSLNFHGGGAWFWNLFSGVLEGVVKNNVDVCYVLYDLMQQYADAQFVESEVNRLAHDAIPKELKISDITRSWGILSYFLFNIMLKEESLPSITLFFNSELGALTWTLSNIGLKLYCDWTVEVSMGIFPITFSGSVDIGVSQVSASITFGLGFDQPYSPFVKALNCTYHIGVVNLNVHGGGAWFWNLFSDVLEGVIKNYIDPCEQIYDIISKYAENR